MPKKYVINTRRAPNRSKAVSKWGVIAGKEGCLKCPVCAKGRCVHTAQERPVRETGHRAHSGAEACANCLVCVQSCPGRVIYQRIKPAFKKLGYGHWSPDVITQLWSQAETGKIPVSGAGYSGPFSGPGFDGMWTDMSEIVRPTRDGIQGREYISTSVDLGRKKRSLAFNQQGNPLEDFPHLLDIPLPIILRVPPFGSFGEGVIRGWAMAASRLGTLLALPPEHITRRLEDFIPHLMPVLPARVGAGKRGREDVRVIGVPWDEWEEHGAGSSFPLALPSVSLPMMKGVKERALGLARSGAPILHLQAGWDGKALDDPSVSMKEVIRSIHRAFVERGIRDEVTLLAGGGISMAEHVAKAVICGADAVVIDFPILIALQCRMCRRCARGSSCPVEIEKAHPAWVAARVINLLAAWHSQLIEVMGAMGIRDVRRLRGETGRAMFFEDLDQATFGSMGEVKEGYELV